MDSPSDIPCRCADYDVILSAIFKAEYQHLVFDELQNSQFFSQTTSAVSSKPSPDTKNLSLVPQTLLSQWPNKVIAR